MVEMGTVMLHNDAELLFNLVKFEKELCDCHFFKKKKEQTNFSY